MRSVLVLGALAACSFGDTRELVLEGPPQLTVDQLGPVEGPKVLLSDGSAPEGLEWRVEPDHVARLEGGGVSATAPGEATVTATWNGKSVSWSLVVDPRITLQLVRTPETLTVGERQPLHLEARMGKTSVDPGEVKWSSSDVALATVEAGVVTAVAPGVVYVTARRGGSEAMAEIRVIAPE